MTKATNILIIGALLIASVFANLTVYQCVHDGELCMTKTCCEVIEEAKSCCSKEDGNEVTYKNICCDEVQIVQSFIFNDNLQSKISSLKPSADYPGILDINFELESLTLCKVIRGPPRPPETYFKAQSPIYISICSFLC